MELAQDDIIRPTRYEVCLALVGAPRFTFEGLVHITLEVATAEPAVRSFLLHARDIGILSGRIHPSGDRVSVRKASADAVSVELSEPLCPGEHCLQLAFSGSISLTRRVGVYACRWKGDNSSDSWTIATHFEPANCRRAFPCFDLPHLKARFLLTLVTRDLPEQALSNGDVELAGSHEDLESARLGVAGATLLQQLLERSDNGDAAAVPPRYHITRFKPTPPISTYVFGFWVGRWETVEVPTMAGVPSLRLRVPPGRTSEASFAADWACKALVFFSRLFDVTLPLAKLDLIAVPQMHGVGMEGFGAITIQEDYLLVGPATDYVRRRRVARLLCHEISHQWLGDLVTPATFDDLWLKEATSRLFEYLAVEALDHQGSWAIWNNFILEVMHHAMQADASPDSHAVVQQHHGNVDSIIESFDVITYGKGASVLRMLYEHLGLHVFVAGVRRFLRTSLYGNASMEDMWAALQHAAAEHGVDMGLSVKELMGLWLTRSGCPALHVRLLGGHEASRDGASLHSQQKRTPRLLLWQQPFTLAAPSTASSVCASESGTGKGMTRAERCIPLRLRVGCGDTEQIISVTVGERAAVEVDLGPYLRTSSHADMSVETDGGGGCVEPWIVINHNHGGYFVTIFEGEALWAATERALQEDRMTEVETLGLVCDLMLAVQADCGDAAAADGCIHGLHVALARLQVVLDMLASHGKGGAAWCTAQVFMWEVQVVSIVRAVTECERRRKEWKPPLDGKIEGQATPASLAVLEEEVAGLRAAAEMLRTEVDAQYRSCADEVSALKAGECPLHETLSKLKAARNKVVKLCARLEEPTVCCAATAPAASATSACAISRSGLPAAVTAYHS